MGGKAPQQRLTGTLTFPHRQLLLHVLRRETSLRRGLSRIIECCLQPPLPHLGRAGKKGDSLGDIRFAGGPCNKPEKCLVASALGRVAETLGYRPLQMKRDFDGVRGFLRPHHRAFFDNWHPGPLVVRRRPHEWLLFPS